MKLVFSLFQLISSVAILIYVYMSLPTAEITASWDSIEIHNIIVASALALAIEAVGAGRLRILTNTQGFGVSPLKLFHINLAARFYMLIVPVGTLASMATRFYKLQRLERRRAAALSSILIDRTTVTMGLCIVGGFAWLLGQPSGFSYVGYIACIGLVVGTALLMMLLHPISEKIMRRLLEWYSLNWLQSLMERWCSATSLFYRLSWSAVAGLILLSILPHLIGACIFSILGNSFGVSLDLLTWCWVRTAVILATMVPISLAGLGVREVSLLVLLGGFGFNSANILALAAAIFCVSVLVPALIGGLMEGIGAIRKVASPARFTG